MQRKERMYKLKFMEGVMKLGLIMKKLKEIVKDKLLKDGEYEKKMKMGILQMEMMEIGWRMKRKKIRMIRMRFRERRMLREEEGMQILGEILYFILRRMKGDI